MTNKRLDRLMDLQGVIMQLFLSSEDIDEQEWLQNFSEEIEIKINKLKGVKV